MKKHSMCRRSFIRNSSMGLATLAVAGNMDSLTAQADIAPGPIITRKLGRTDIQLPVISMGVMNADNPAVMKRAYDLGIRHFDTAWRYQNGRNEEMVGDVIRETGIRDKITLATKVPLAFGNRSSYTTEDLEELRTTNGSELEKKLHDDYLATFATSLGRLKLDSVDILYVHSVKDPATITWPFLLDALGKLKQEGKVRFLGVSTHQNEVPIIDQATKSGLFDVILAPLNFKTSRRDSIAAALKRAHDANIGIVAMKTQAIYDSSKETNHTAALKYALQHEFVCTAIPGFTSFDELEEDFSVARDLTYSPEEERFLRDFWARASLGKASNPCERCGQCQPGCPQQANIPDLMRTYMYAAGYKNFEHSRITYEAIPAGRNLTACAGCSSCRATCVNGLNIPSNIRQLKAIYHSA